MNDPPDAGQATVELALALPLVVIMLMALVNVGVVVRDQILVVHAAREAARTAAVDDDLATAAQAAKAAGQLDPSRLEVAIEGRDGRGSRVTVTVSYRAPIELPLIHRVVTELGLKAHATMRVER